MNPREMTTLKAGGVGLPLSVVYEFAGFRLEPQKRLVTNAAGEPVAVASKAYEALLYLVQHAGQLVPRAALTQALWPTTIVEDNNLNQAIAALRRAFGDQHIVTVAGRGYQFVTPVRVVDMVAASNSATEGIAEVSQDASLPAVSTVRQDSGAEALSSRRSRQFATIGLIAGVVAIASAVGAFLYLRVDVPASAARSHPLGAVSQVTTLTTFPGLEISPAFAPDGVRIAYAGGPSLDNTDIFVTQIGGTEPLRLTQGGANRDPAWSPDGTQIAFLKQRDLVHLDLMIVPALGGPARVLRSVRVFSVPHYSSPPLAWTPDGQEILFTTREEDNDAYELNAYSLRSGSSHALGIPQQPGDYDTSPALSADGKRLAFVRYRPGSRFGRLQVQELAPGLVPVGEPFEIPGQEQGIVHSPAWSSDGRLLRVVMGSRIREWDGREIRMVQTLAASIDAMSIREGKQVRAVVSVINTDLDIYAIPLDPRTRVATGPPAVRVKSTSIEEGPRFSPDGHKLAFVSGRSGRRALWIADAGGENPHQLTFLDTALVGYARWSPDGTHIAFQIQMADLNAERIVYVIDASGGTPRRLGPGCCPFSWSADGKYLYVGAMDTRLRVARMSVADGRRETLFEGDQTTESADGKLLLYAKGLVPGIFARSLEGDPAKNPEKRLVEDYTPPLGSIVPVATGFFYLGHSLEGKPRAFRFYDYALKAAKDIAPAPPTMGRGMSLSPDESELVYAADERGAGSDLALLDFASASESN
jgi:Tol biopolymer transport system component/DNA-binding winged helix-turn-helix (wHTH) protein